MIFVDNLDNDCLENLVEVKKMIVREFEGYYMPKKIQISNVTNDLDYCLKRIDLLRSVNFCLISFKHLVDTNNKQEDKH